MIEQEGSLSLTCLWGVVLFSNWADPCLAYQVSITNPCRRICGPIVDRSHPVARLITRLFSHLLSPGRGRKDSMAGRESCCRPSEWRTESLAVIKGWQQSRRRETSAKTKALLWWNIQGEAAHSNALLPYPQNANATPKPSRHCQLITEHCLHNYIQLHQCLIANRNRKKEMKLKEKSKGKKHTKTHTVQLKKENGPRSVQAELDVVSIGNPILRHLRKGKSAACLGFYCKMPPDGRQLQIVRMTLGVGEHQLGCDWVYSFLMGLYLV